MGTSRLESFSDGVIAVAITLLVLNITVPPPGTRDLAHFLGHQWPEYLAYVISFLTIGIIWINHHAMIGRLREADHTILILNLLLLMTIGILPFATDLVAKHRHESLAAAIYSGCFLLMALVFSLLNRQVLIVRGHLLAEPLPLAERRQIFRRAASGVVAYVLATALAFVSPYLTLGICAAIALYYATPLASGGLTSGSGRRATRSDRSSSGPATARSGRPHPGRRTTTSRRAARPTACPR